jgi:hypothetical protein
VDWRGASRLASDERQLPSAFAEHHGRRPSPRNERLSLTMLRWPEIASLHGGLGRLAVLAARVAKAQAHDPGPKREHLRVCRVLRMELAGLKPATSWVRSRPRAKVRATSAPHASRDSPRCRGLHTELNPPSPLLRTLCTERQIQRTRAAAPPASPHRGDDPSAESRFDRVRPQQAAESTQGGTGCEVRAESCLQQRCC